MKPERNQCLVRKGNPGERFFVVCLLMLLNEKTAHGYELAENLSYFGFETDEINLSTIYRNLRKMEEDCLVTSFWQEGEQGPQKRVYEITDRGKKELEFWTEMLKKRKTRIEKLLARFDQQNTKHKGD